MQWGIQRHIFSLPSLTSRVLLCHLHNMHMTDALPSNVGPLLLPVLLSCFECDELERSSLIWISIFHSTMLWKPFMFSFLFISPSFHPLCFPDTHTPLYLPFVVVVTGFSQPENKLHFRWVQLQKTSIKCPHALSCTHICTKKKKKKSVHVFFFSLDLFHLAHSSLYFFILCLSTAERHQQVSWLGQFGWYNCYYQHPTFRRISGIHTDLSALLLPPWHCTAAVSLDMMLCVWRCAASKA